MFHRLPNTVWADGNLAEVAVKLGNMGEHPNQCQLNPGLRRWFILASGSHRNPNISGRLQPPGFRHTLPARALLLRRDRRMNGVRVQLIIIFSNAKIVPIIQWEEKESIQNLKQNSKRRRNI